MLDEHLALTLMSLCYESETGCVCQQIALNEGVCCMMYYIVGYTSRVTK